MRNIIVIADNTSWADGHSICADLPALRYLHIY